MAVRRKQYAQELEKELAGNKSLEEAHKAAAKKATVKRTGKSDEKSLIAKTKQRLAKLFGKKKTVKPTASEKRVVKKRVKKKYPQMAQAGWGKPKKKVTKRTKQVSGQLAKAGLTKEEIARFRKK